MKLETQLPNHEIWTECTCGAIYDARMHGTACPECGANTPLNRKVFTFAAAFSFTVIMLLFAIGLLATSCISRQYGYRHHRNTVAQKVLQYEHCRPDKYGEWKVCQHFNERPKNHWPFRD